MDACIKNKLVIVTGGANGLGNMYVRHLLLKGAKAVGILDVDVALGTEITKKLNAEFGHNRVTFIPTDVSKSDQFDASFKQAVNHLGGLDIMINNAGILNESKWNLMIDINIKALIQGTMMAINRMGKHNGGKGGTVINVGSIAAFVVAKYTPAYCATKHAVVGFTRGIALSYEETGVALKAICPGATDTSLIRDESHRYLEYINQEEGREWIRTVSLQQPEIMAREVMRLIEEAPNGAIWVNTLETSTISLDIPDFTTWGTRV